MLHSVVIDVPFTAADAARDASELGSEAAAARELEAYVGPAGVVRQCSNCRRTQRGTQDGWDWVRTFVMAQPPNVTHGICTTCLRQDYPDVR